MQEIIEYQENNEMSLQEWLKLRRQARHNHYHGRASDLELALLQGFIPEIANRNPKNALTWSITVFFQDEPIRATVGSVLIVSMFLHIIHNFFR